MVTGNQAIRKAPFLPAARAASTFCPHLKWRDEGFSTSDCPRMLAKNGLTFRQEPTTPV